MLPHVQDTQKRVPPLGAERGLSGGEFGNGDAERAATDVIQPEAMAELHALRIAAVFAANPELDLWPRFA